MPEWQIRGTVADWLHAPLDMQTVRDRYPDDDLRIIRHLRQFPPGKTLFAGPWIGELGWELMRWQGGVRRMARSHEGRIVVMGDPGHGVLYEFAHEYWETPPCFLRAGLTRQCIHVRSGPVGEWYVSLLTHLVAEQLSGEDVVCLTPRRFREGEQDFVQLSTLPRWSTRVPEPYACIVPRFRQWNRRKNWSEECWTELCSLLSGRGLAPQIVSSPDEICRLASSLEVSPHDSLARSIDLLSHARFAVASESGGALLCLLCGCPTLVFGHKKWEQRITVHENPLRTPVRYLARTDYSFSVEEVANAARDFYENL